MKRRLTADQRMMRRRDGLNRAQKWLDFAYRPMEKRDLTPRQKEQRAKYPKPRIPVTVHGNPRDCIGIRRAREEFEQDAQNWIAARRIHNRTAQRNRKLSTSPKRIRRELRRVRGRWHG